MTPHIQALIDELRLPRYASMDAKQVAAVMNTLDETRKRKSVSGAEIYEAVVDSEFTDLTASQQQQVRDIWSLGQEVDIQDGAKARAVMLRLFPSGKTTRTNLIALAGESISLGEKIGARVPVKPGHVEEARRFIDRVA